MKCNLYNKWNVIDNNWNVIDNNWNVVDNKWNVVEKQMKCCWKTNEMKFYW